MQLLHKPTIRIVRHALKTGLAALVCMLVTDLIGLKYGYWSVISAVIVMQSDLGGSLRAAWIRVSGTLVGGLTGVALLFFFPPSPMLLGAAVFLTIMTCAFVTGMQESFRIAGITAAILILAWPGDVPVHEFGMHRLLEIFVGVMVGLGVSVFVWPAMATSALRLGLSQELRDGAAILRMAVECFLEGTEGPSPEMLDKVRENLRTNRELCITARREHLDYRRRRQRFLLTITTVERMMDYVQALADAAEHARPDGYQSLLKAEIRTAGEDCARFMELLAESFAGIAVSEDLPRIDNALAEVEKKVFAVRKAGAGAKFTVDEVMNSFSFFYSLKSLSELLSRTAGDAWAMEAELGGRGLFGRRRR